MVMQVGLMMPPHRNVAAVIGEAQPIDLLRAGGGSPRMEALKDMGERPFRIRRTVR